MFSIFFFALLLGALFGLHKLQQKHIKFSKRVFLALGIGVGFGLLLQLLAPEDSLAGSLQLMSWIGSAYVRLLQMIVMPLIIVSILSAIVNLNEGGKALGRMSAWVIGILVGTAAVAALVGAGTANLFGLNAQGLSMGAQEQQRASLLEQKLQGLQQQSLAERFLEFIPTNPFLDFTGGRDTSTVAVVVFTAFLGVAALGLAKKKPASLQTFRDMTNALHDVVMRLVTLILRLTPYGVMALMAKVVGGSDPEAILKLGKFVLASYVALGIMFCIQLLLLLPAGLSPLPFLRKAWPVLSFAFSSRTSMGAIPLNIETQTEELGVDEGTANLSASLGASIGQNGCAAIYPAMLAVMIAPTVGIDPTSLSFLGQLVVIVAASSFGVAGVGGGATFAALIVLSSMNLPVGLVGLLISVEPLIDMGRTALNVNGSMLSGVLTSRIMGSLDVQTYQRKVGEEIEG